mgnify:CR=1 FL=1
MWAPKHVSPSNTISEPGCRWLTGGFAAGALYRRLLWDGNGNPSIVARAMHR